MLYWFWCSCVTNWCLAWRVLPLFEELWTALLFWNLHRGLWHRGIWSGLLLLTYAPVSCIVLFIFVECIICHYPGFVSNFISMAKFVAEVSKFCTSFASSFSTHDKLSAIGKNGGSWCDDSNADGAVIVLKDVGHDALWNMLKRFGESRDPWQIKLMTR